MPRFPFPKALGAGGQPASRPRVRLEQLDALRGALALYVLIGHARWLLWVGHAAWLSQPHEGWQVPLAYASATFRFGREAVLIFFALSGFFIHSTAASRLAAGQDVGFNAGRFLQRRAHRLVPPYLFALVATVVCDVIGRAWFPRLYLGATGDPLLDQSIAGGGYTASSIVPAVLLLPSAWGQHFGSNGPLWSLAYEVVYYLAYPFWLWLRCRSGVLAYAAVPVAILVMAPAVGPSFLSTVLVWWPAWIAGAGLAEYLCAARARRPAAPIAVVVFLLALAGYLTVPSLQLKALCAAAFAIAAVYTFATAAVRPDRLGVRLLEYLGKRSFSIYIFHFPFLVLMGAAVIQTAGARPTTGWLAVGGAALAVIYGCGCFTLCERHFLHRRAEAAVE